ncbi:hypothetical protein [Rhizobium sp. Nf11,1]|uniref:hypothetical protein n=1 Tax=Rhizobium sp. Nf11,1 TaxID=3404923 RepID=UPI003D332809
MAQIAHLRRSRIVKAITDVAGSDKDFEQADIILNRILPTIKIDRELAVTAAGQAAVLTALTTSIKCFGSANLVCDFDAPLKRRLSLGSSLFEAAHAIGATITQSVPGNSTHLIAIGNGPDEGAFVRCWWDRWTAGILPPWDEELAGVSGNPLAGVFAGGLAVREVFANAIGRRRNVNQRSVLSLWCPWNSSSVDDVPPSILTLPGKLWFVGLGHLGQGYLWNLAFLPVSDTHAILQDDQEVGEENVATGLLTRHLDFETHNNKARVSARWLEEAGWTTNLIERRNYGDIRLTPEDPPVVLTSIDEPLARIEIAKAGHQFLIDAGVGHGALDFEIGQIRVVPSDIDPESLWSRQTPAKDIDAVLRKVAYIEHARKHDRCGTFTLAEASVAVPFVGATVGALGIAQLLRLAALGTTPQILQIELGMPQGATRGVLNPPSPSAFGGSEFSFA